MTTPTAINGNGSSMVASDTQPTAPAAVSNNAPAVQSGVATKYWLELKAYPAGSARSLFLLVNNSWKRLDNPSGYISDIVQRAFSDNGVNVRVWFDGTLIKGLVVEGS